MDCTIMKKPPSQTLLDYSILSLAVFPELYDIMIVCYPLSAGGRVETLNFQKGGLDRGYCWPFQGGCNFYIKNKLKSEMFKYKKSS